MGTIDRAVVSELVTLRRGLAVLWKKWLQVNIASMSGAFCCSIFTEECYRYGRRYRKE